MITNPIMIIQIIGVNRMEECDHSIEKKCYYCQFKEVVCKTCRTLLKIIPIEDYDKTIKRLDLEDKIL